MHVVLLSGSPAARSRTEVLLDYVRQRLEAQHVEVSWLRVRDFPAEDLLHARFDSPAVQLSNSPMWQQVDWTACG